MNISEKLKALRLLMSENKIDMYCIPTDDYHGSEYVGEYFKSREFISGFTGSAGTVIVTKDYAGLWTDGRYFIQAENELKGTEYVLNKSGEEGVPTVTEFIKRNIGNGILGFDGKTLSYAFVKSTKLSEDKIKTIDLINEIWIDRPTLPYSDAYSLAEKYSGMSTNEKIKLIRDMMPCDAYVLSAPDDICWLLNIRGNDISYNPVVLSYLYMTRDRLVLFADKNKLAKNNPLNNIDIEIYDYDEFYSFLKNIKEKSVYIDESRLNYEAYVSIPENVKKLSGANLTLIKAKKNPTEVQNERLAHLKDGIAVTKFIYEVKNNPEKYTELSAADLIINLRKQNENYVEESFEPIIAYREHGAIVHYSANEKTNSKIKADGFLLCDTGGHYLEGTTDITRTIALGNVTNEMKRDYTAVLRGHLNLAGAVFTYGSVGANLDILAREPLWELGMDFNHGTGHGVGYLLNVHESPNGIRRKFIPEHDCVLEEGMITSDEPGVYIEGKYGIRIESLVVCREYKKTVFGRFMNFENLTLAPFDPDAVDKSLMTEKEIKLYNDYQERVYAEISPYLTEKEREWLKNETRKI